MHRVCLSHPMHEEWHDTSIPVNAPPGFVCLGRSPSGQPSGTAGRCLSLARARARGRHGRRRSRRRRWDALRSDPGGGGVHAKRVRGGAGWGRQQTRRVVSQAAPSYWVRRDRGHRKDRVHAAALRVEGGEGVVRRDAPARGGGGRSRHVGRGRDRLASRRVHGRGASPPERRPPQPQPDPTPVSTRQPSGVTQLCTRTTRASNSRSSSEPTAP